MHDSHCTVRAMISALENYRDAFPDADQASAYRFAEDGTMVAWARYYLAEGMQPCTCRAVTRPDTASGRG